MTNSFKPANYNSVSPYFIVEDATKFIDFLKAVFDGKELRRYNNSDGSVMHAEFQIDDSVIMLGSSSDKFKPIELVLHVYVPNVDETFAKAIQAGCESIKEPGEQKGDPDRRGTFKDPAGNMWSIGTQLH
jgi:uncharacterized glyoxalase superfamily protein PhnB